MIITNTDGQSCETDFEFEHKNTAAKNINDKYFVLASKDGNLFDPRFKVNLNKKDLDRGGLFYTLQRCSRDCYVAYVTFLKSKNGATLNVAQRRFLSDSKGI